MSATEQTPDATVEFARGEILAQLRAALSPSDNAGVDRCAERLREVLGNAEQPVVLVAYGGGKDSSYMLAFVRAVQLRLFQCYGTAFVLRSVTNRHAGMPEAVMHNIARAYRRLGLTEDPSAQLLLVDGYRVSPFEEELPQDAGVVSRNRTDILMNGHRTGADGRPTFCNACNLSMVNSFGVAAGYDGGVDVIVTGDSRTEQRDYQLWVRKLARRFGMAQPPVGNGFGGFLQAADVIAEAYFTDLYGRDDETVLADHRISSAVPPRLTFFSVYDDTHYDSGSHWELLTELLGFEFDEVAFSFTESDCANPGLMAHLRGLKTERVFGREYREGIAEYVEFAVNLMRTKEFPPRLIEVVLARYADEAGVSHMRRLMDSYARSAYGLREQHLVCMVHAPFVEKGAGLARYLAAEQPDLLDCLDSLHLLLAGTSEPGDDPQLAGLTDRLTAFSGLELSRLRVLYGGPGYRNLPIGPGRGDVIQAILADDPHKRQITSRHSPTGPLVAELLSGR